MGIDERLRLFASLGAFVLLLSIMLLSSCEQQFEGCLDFRALSVDVAADNACEDCCVYPSLELQFIPVRFNPDNSVSKVLRASDTLISGPLTGKLPEFAFYLHDISLIADDGDRFEMQDTFTVFADGEEPNFVFRSSILRVSPFRQTSYNLGTLLEEKSFVAVEASLGLPDRLSAADVDLQPTSSPLFRNADTLLVSFVNNSYLDAAFKFEQPDGLRDSFELADGIDRSIRWDLPAPLGYIPSFNAQITLGFPADNLLEINERSVTGDNLVTEVLAQAQVLQVVLSRPQ